MGQTMCCTEEVHYFVLALPKTSENFTHEDYQNLSGQLVSYSSAKEQERFSAETSPHSRANESNELQTGSPFCFRRVLCL